MKITAIVENSVYNKHLWGEEGLSFLIESSDIKPVQILFDCGRSGTVAMHNLDVLDVDLNKVQYLILSHGHSGHIGGVMNISTALSESCIVLHPGIFCQKFKLTDNKIQPSGDQPALRKLKTHYTFKIAEKPLWLSDTIVVSGKIPKDKNNIGLSNTHYFVKGYREIEPDLFEEELALGIKTNEGIVVLTACAHRGLLNTIHYILSLFNGLPLFGIVGGFHLFDNEDATKKLIEQVKYLNPKVLAPCHCTGLISSATFYSAFPKEYHRFTTGDVIVFK